MPRIRVIKDTPAVGLTPDGRIDPGRTETYRAGSFYTMPQGLAQVFVDNGWGREVDADRKPAPVPGKPDHPASKRETKVSAPKTKPAAKPFTVGEHIAAGYFPILFEGKPYHEGGSMLKVRGRPKAEKEADRLNNLNE